MQLQLHKPHKVTKPKTIYQKICANPDCLKDFETSHRDTKYCRRGCKPQVHSKGLVAPSHDDPLPVDSRGFFDADTFCQRYYEEGKIYNASRFGNTTIHIIKQ
jgi:hypothetical protein